MSSLSAHLLDLEADHVFIQWYAAINIIVAHAFRNEASLAARVSSLHCDKYVYNV